MLVSFYIMIVSFTPITFVIYMLIDPHFCACADAENLM